MNGHWGCRPSKHGKFSSQLMAPRKGCRSFRRQKGFGSPFQGESKGSSFGEANRQALPAYRGLNSPSQVTFVQFAELKTREH